MSSIIKMGVDVGWVERSGITIHPVYTENRSCKRDVAKPNSLNVVDNMLGFTRISTILGFSMNLTVIFCVRFLVGSCSTQPTR